jgi:hypothetical protein
VARVAFKFFGCKSYDNEGVTIDFQIQGSIDLIIHFVTQVEVKLTFLSIQILLYCPSVDIFLFAWILRRFPSLSYDLPRAFALSVTEN